MQNILKSYLTNRYQFIKINNTKFLNQKSDCGISQGLTQGPLLLILYVNDLPSVTEFSTTLFADDTNLALADDNLSQLKQLYLLIIG